MNHSVKRFVKKWSDRTYTPHEFEILANDMAIDSDNRYTQKSALKVLARYAKPDGDVIRIDPNDRQYNRTYESIIKNLDIESESESADEVNYDKSDESDNSDENDKELTNNAENNSSDDSVHEKNDDASSDSDNNVNYDKSESESDDVPPKKKVPAKKLSGNKGTIKATANTTTKVTAKETVKATAKVTAKVTAEKTPVKKTIDKKTTLNNDTENDKVVKSAKTVKTAKVAKVIKAEPQTKLAKSQSKSSSESNSKSSSGSQSKKKSPKMMRATFPERPKNVKLAQEEVIKIKEIEPSPNVGKNTKLKKKIVEKIDPSVTTKEAARVDNPSRKVNLFTKKKLDTQNTNVVETKKSSQLSSKSAQSTKATGKVTKEKKIQPNLDSLSESDDNNQDISDKNRYTYPTDANTSYKGVFRSDPLYGPYGTDNYHDEDQDNDDVSDSDYQRILKVFQYLDAIEYPAQRSKEWFAMRNEVASASDGGTVVGLNPYENVFDFIVKKVHGKPFQTSIDCYHGKKYEQVATMSYEYRMNVKVKEFGLCRHPKHRILGASPDGIVCEYKLRNDFNEDWEKVVARFDKIRDQIIEEQAKIDGDPSQMNEVQKEDFYRKVMIKFNKKKERLMDPKCKKTKYVGRMLEIKCPYRRKILMDPKAPEVYGPHGEPITDIKKDVKKGVCPAYYWVQVQLQLECCDLDECDFWQTEIWEYEDAEDFVEDTDPDHPWLSASSKQEKGALIQIVPFDKINDESMEYMDRIYNFAEFIYQPRVDMTPQEVDMWLLETIKNLKWTHKGYVFESVKYYKIINTRSITIKRDTKWFAENLPKFQEIWGYVEYFRANEDKSKLLKKYLQTFKTDYYGKIKEHYNGEIMEMISKVYNEPKEKAPAKDHRAYARYIQSIEDIIKDSGIEDDPEPVIADVEDDMKEIREALEYESDEDMDQKERISKRKEHIEFVKKMKKLVESYLYVDA